MVYTKSIKQSNPLIMPVVEFSDYCAQIDAKNLIKANALKYTMLLCVALEDDYRKYSIRMTKGSLARDPGNAYLLNRLEDLEEGLTEIRFIVETGRKYHKIIQCDENSRSVHAFVDKNTGEVYKAASWKAPAKHVRFDFRIIEQRDFVLENCDWAGGYLYLK